jgi:hypothetical protein
VEFEEGFGFNLDKVKLVLINGFYSHMFLQKLYYEEIINMCCRLRDKSQFVMINQTKTNIFDGEKVFVSELLSDIKIKNN